MKITEENVKQIAALARLKFSEKETETFTRQFADIVKFVEQLGEVDTTNIDEIHVHQDKNSRLNNDDVISGFTKEESLHNAPAKDNDYFLVPKVIAGEGEHE